jgi:2-polyprenyl-6-methoxyphenol hydroxylase-like FAD-dependent oxidoreductase
VSRLRVAVAGGGLGGLCLAQGLLRDGADVTVYERDESLSARQQGYRLHVDARTGLALQQCLPPESLELFLATCGQPSTERTVVSERLRVLHTERAADSRADPFTPATLSTSVNRQTLREVLARGLDGRLVFGREVTGYELAGPGVRVRFADGGQADADLLVGADGVGSAVRRQFLPAATADDTGTRCVYGRTPLAGLALPPFMTRGFTAVAGGRIGMAVGVVRFRQPPQNLGLSPAGDYLMWALAQREQFGLPESEFRDLDPAGLHKLAGRLTRSWHPELRALVDRADTAATFGVRIQVSRPVTGWTPGPVTVLGDAIHAMSPARGSGANTALRDAAVLSRSLGRAMRVAAAGELGAAELAGAELAGAELAGAVGEYEEQMRDYGYAAVAASRQAEAEMGRGPGRLAAWLLRRLPR